MASTPDQSSGALLALAGDIPAPVVADLLGMSVSTATRWASYSKGDWTEFLAMRASSADGEAMR